MTDAQHKITAYEQSYREVFKDEYAQFLVGQQENLALKKNTFSEVEGSELIERKLGEIPATLYSMLHTRLTAEEFEWFRSKPGSHWFFRTFPQYRETKSI